MRYFLWHGRVRSPQIEVQDIDHLGIVAGIVDEIGLVEQIDELLGIHSQEHISSGQAVKAMILNGLGFVSAPLYLFEEFFLRKATEHLIAPGIRPEHLNDDRLGRVLDKLFEANLSRTFIIVALLLVYALGERLLRRALEEGGTGIRHQTGKPTQRPTLRWVFQLFQAVHLLSVDGKKRIANLTEEREHILGFLLPGCRRCYLL